MFHTCAIHTTCKARPKWENSYGSTTEKDFFSSTIHHNVLGGGSGVAQQLDFGVGGVGEGGERLVELAAQVEDLTYQLSTTQEELQAAVERAEQAEVKFLSYMKVQKAQEISTIVGSNLTHNFFFTYIIITPISSL